MVAIATATKDEFRAMSGSEYCENIETLFAPAAVQGTKPQPPAAACTATRQGSRLMFIAAANG